MRRALVTGSDLSFPEGVAAAEVLKVGDTSEGAADNRRGLHVIVWGAISSAFFSLLTNLKVALSSVTTAFKVGAGGTMVGTSLSLALIGIGHLVGLGVGIAMICGMLISYGVLLPYFSSGQLGSGDIAEGVQEFCFRCTFRRRWHHRYRCDLDVPKNYWTDFSRNARIH